MDLQYAAKKAGMEKPATTWNAREIVPSTDFAKTEPVLASTASLEILVNFCLVQTNAQEMEFVTTEDVSAIMDLKATIVQFDMFSMEMFCQALKYSVKAAGTVSFVIWKLVLTTAIEMENATTELVSAKKATLEKIVLWWVVRILVRIMESAQWDAAFARMVSKPRIVQRHIVQRTVQAEAHVCPENVFVILNS